MIVLVLVYVGVDALRSVYGTGMGECVERKRKKEKERERKRKNCMRHTSAPRKR